MYWYECDTRRHMYCIHVVPCHLCCTHDTQWRVYTCDMTRHVCIDFFIGKVHVCIDIFIGKVVFICLRVSINLVSKFQGKPGTTTVKHDINPNGLKFHRGSPWVSILSWLNFKANKDYFSYKSVDLSLQTYLYLCNTLQHTATHTATHCNKVFTDISLSLHLSSRTECAHISYMLQSVHTYHMCCIHSVVCHMCCVHVMMHQHRIRWYVACVAYM